MLIQLASSTEKARLRDPAGHASEQVIEHRVDPLTGSVASVNAALGEKAKAFLLGGSDLQLLADYQEKTRAGCPFCVVAEKGTRFLPETIPEGQLRIGRAVAVPNLFSKVGFDAVAIVDPSRHVLFPAQLEVAALADAIRASSELVRRARRLDAAFVHHVAGMNFLPPGGSSMPHPHFQIHVRGVPYSALAQVMAASAAFLQRTGKGYWDTLLAEEKQRGARFIGATGDVQWLAPWAPSHQREVWGVLPGVTSLTALTDADAGAFAAGISKVITAYEAMSNHPFTFAFFSSPDAAARGFALHVRICSRPAFKSIFSNYDTWFTPLFMHDDVQTQTPEEYAAVLRQRW